MREQVWFQKLKMLLCCGGKLMQIYIVDFILYSARKSKEKGSCIYSDYCKTRAGNSRFEGACFFFRYTDVNCKFVMPLYLFICQLMKLVFEMLQSAVRDLRSQLKPLAMQVT